MIAQTSTNDNDLPIVSEFRVMWQREGWVQSKSRTFQIQGAAVRFARRLWRDEGPQSGRWAPVAWLRIDCRSCGPWATWESRP